jgi:Mg-chelatase subunit ChlD
MFKEEISSREGQTRPYRVMYVSHGLCAMFFNPGGCSPAGEGARLFLEKTMGIHQRALDKALTITARMFADQAGIQVKRGARASAATDGRVIYLPQHRNELVLSDEDITLNLGYIFHETGHILHTDLSCMGVKPIQKAIMNILEDVRIERRLFDDFHIVRRHLDRLTGILVKRGEAFESVRESDTKPRLFQALMLYKLRAEVLGQKALSELAKGAEEACQKAFPPTMLLNLETRMNRVLRCKSTADVARLSEEILKMLEEEEQNEEPDPPDQDSQQDQEDSGDCQGQNQGQAGNGQPKPGQQDVPESDLPNGQKHSGGGHGGSIRELLEMSEEDIERGVGERLAQHVDQIAQENAGRNVLPLRFPSVHPHCLDGASMSLDKIRASSNALRNRMMQWQSRAQDGDAYHVNSGTRFDAKRLWARRFGTPTFLREEEGIDLEAAISVVVDRSGSMHDVIQTVIEASVATAMAFEHPSIAHQVIAFPWGAECEPGVSVIKGWDENVRKLANRIPNMDAQGGTPMAEAILFSASQLAVRPEPRRVMLVITDGEPNNLDQATENVKLARQHGIHVMGLGVGINPVSVFGEADSASIKGIQDLASTMIALLKNAFIAN